jgi:cyclopropane-fatty-acyl-phospholipid synthase
MWLPDTGLGMTTQSATSVNLQDPSGSPLVVLGAPIRCGVWHGLQGDTPLGRGERPRRFRDFGAWKDRSVATCATVTPRSAAAVVDKLARALLGAPLPLNVRCWDGSKLEGPPGAPTLVLNNRRALRRFLYSPNELGLARAYVSGDLDVVGDLYAALGLPDQLESRPDLKLDARTVAGVAGLTARLGVIGPPPRPPVEETRAHGALHSVRRDRQSVSHHYDVGNEFYRLLLGPSMVYSCAYFRSPSTSLEDAQRSKLELVSRKLGLRPGMRLLDVGCGWGSMALHAAAHHGVDVVAVTISREQADLARQRVADAGLQRRVEIRLQDYREVSDGPFDAISSIGMAEHVGSAQLSAYAQRLFDLLRPGGALVNHAIARGPAAGPDKGADSASFVVRYVFPDGELQSLGVHVGVLEESGFEVRDVEALRENYALTCRAWVSNLERQWPAAVRASSEGRARVWRLYLVGSALAFESRRVGVNQVLAVKPLATALASSSLSAMELPLRRPCWTDDL